MKRGHTVLEYQAEDPPLREVRPDISISTDLIVGFPGETEADFEATMELIEDVGFDQSFSFIYSPRPGTPAAALADPVPDEEKLAATRGIAGDASPHRRRTISRDMVGTVQRVLVNGRRARIRASLPAGPRNNRWVNFDGPPDCIGRFVDLHITEALPNSLRGRLVLSAVAA